MKRTVRLGRGIRTGDRTSDRASAPPAPSTTDRGSLCAYRCGPSPTRPSHHLEPGSSQPQHAIENPAKRFRVDVAIHANASAPTKFDCYITALPTRMGRGGRFRPSGGDCRSCLGHDHRHQGGRRLVALLFDPAQLLTPTEQLADMNTSRAGNFGDDRVWLKAGSDEALFIFA